jgi:ElaB/YqjD/DUF883 family membrane-anchored ribosome-binding protein
MQADAKRQLDELRKELAALRHEIETPQPKSQAADASADAPLDNTVDTATRETNGQFKEFSGAVREFLDETQDNIGEHPFASVAASFVLGLVIGMQLER